MHSTGSESHRPRLRKSSRRAKAATAKPLSAWLAHLRGVLAGVPGTKNDPQALAVTAAERVELASAPPPGYDQATQTPGARGRAARRGQAPAAPNVELEAGLERSVGWLLQEQKPEGYWVAELEADTTLESYFILFKAFFGQRDHPKIPKYARVIQECMLPAGGWAIFRNGPFDISVSVLSYFALKVAGLSAEDPGMRRARERILAAGGVAKANTYTKYHLAWFDQYDWEHVPAIPPEMIFIPALAPINIYEMSSWSRTIFVTLSIIYALKPVCLLPQECHIDELFPKGHTHADLALPRSKKAFTWTNFFLLSDKALKIAEKFPIQTARQAAIKKAEQWMIQRFEASGGLGAILPAMMNSVLALKILGHRDDESLLREGIRHLDELEIEDPADGTIRIQPCHSPVWDTAISTYALAQADLAPASETPGPGGREACHPALRKAVAWLLSKEVKRPGDWQVKNPCPPGGWFFEFENEFYPDVDDTIMAMMALRTVSPLGQDERVDAAIGRALTWTLGMQNADGGWASFDRDNDMAFLTKVPFADHNAMIDPSTADITSRTLEMFAYIAPETYTLSHPVVKRALRFIKRDQCRDGSWIGRWGVNYLYGTWQVLRGLNLIGEDLSQGYSRKAVEWLKEVQLPDGGWGERADTYEHPERKGLGPSTASQTAWALMGLLAAGQGQSQAVTSGLRYLLDSQTPAGTWEEDEWTGTGFPKVFYLKYHYYRHYWPLMAFAQQRRFLRGERP